MGETDDQIQEAKRSTKIRIHFNFMILFQILLFTVNGGGAVTLIVFRFAHYFAARTLVFAIQYDHSDSVCTQYKCRDTVITG